MTTNIYKIGLYSAIVSAISWVAYVFAGTGFPDLAAAESPLEYFQLFSGARMSYLVYGWAGVLGTLLVVPYVLAFYDALKSSSAALLALVVSLLGVALATIGFFKPLAAIYYLVPLALEAAEELLPTYRVAVEVTLQILEGPWNLGSFLVFGLGFFLFALLSGQQRVAPSWVNGVGLLAGLAGLVWLNGMFNVLPSVMVTVMVLTNIVGAIVWSISFSVILHRSKR